MYTGGRRIRRTGLRSILLTGLSRGLQLVSGTHCYTSVVGIKDEIVCWYFDFLKWTVKKSKVRFLTPRKNKEPNEGRFLTFSGDWAE